MDNEPRHEDYASRANEHKRQLDRIEADGKLSLLETKRCLRILLGEDTPSAGLVSRVERLEDFTRSIRDERKGFKGWLGKIIGGLVGAGALLWLQKVFGIKHP